MPVRLAFCLLLGSSLLSLTNCRLGDERYTLRGGSNVRVRVLYDSIKVRSLAERAAQIEGSPQSTDDFLLSRKGKAFMTVKEEMDREPWFEVAGGTSFKILFELPNLFYSKVQFTDGPFISQMGWVPKGSFDDPRSSVP